MNTFEKAKILGSAGKYDSCGPKMCEVNVDSGLGGIYLAKAENKSCKLFKTLMSNSCSYDCKYCGNANKCAKKKTSYKPDELAGLFMHLHKTIRVDGLFLSSAVSGNPDRVTEEMIESVRLLRNKFRYRGYVHFKVLPGTSYELVKQASELSTRMSINIEAPNKEALSELSSCKDFKSDILKRQAWISNLKLSGGQSTQMIVSNLSADKDVLKMTDWEYNAFNLRRMYFSAFRPVKGTALENEKPVPLTRQNRLYNVDFLMREYKYGVKEFDAIMDDGMLPREDPKLALAKQSFEKPVDVNECSYQELIRIPGIGPKTAGRIFSSKEKITKYEQLHRFGATLERAKPFLKIGGQRQAMIGEF
ncbi:MAG: helix-hairpin-helix domain-containing protein [Candidatus Woesearchaeota archaeon]